ncbi:MAG: epoxyqueuosine reductase QueH [Candidatus Neomarinimicrobiota bacterium]
MKQKILLHTCCAVCASACLERLASEDLEPVLFFSNHNISPKEEYQRRLEAARKLSKLLKVELIEDIYDHASWLEVVKGYEDEPEKGSRCGLCFNYSFARTAAYAEEHGFEHFTSTLTVSPHKISKMIFKIGEKYPAYRPWDFKKKDGFKRSNELSRELELYRQNYCGCEFSLRDMRPE